MNVFWFRRDLRLEDNTALFHALNSGEDVLPVFIFDKNILSELSKDDARITFIHALLGKINSALKNHNTSLAVFYDEPQKAFAEIIAENNIKTIYANHDYEPYARKRDKDMNDFFRKNGIEFKTCKDQVIFEKSDIAKDDGTPYVVFTPYSKKWLAKFHSINQVHYKSQDLLAHVAHHSYPFLSLETIGFEKSKVSAADFDISNDLIAHYEETRNFPALETSHLSPHLRFGSASIRKIARNAALEKNFTFLKELIWREFFMQILWHFPETVTKSFRPKYDRIKWRNSETDFKKWCDGKTGLPIVDAGMRELNNSGYMHNRVRMIVASFLCKHLLIDWRWGEAYFAEKLLDYEQSSNIGNWQWAAGSGVDAAPYFRIFNPAEQQKKFDRDFEYIRKWVPEMDTAEYPEPMVDHKEARERCLNAYKAAVG